KDFGGLPGISWTRCQRKILPERSLQWKGVTVRDPDSAEKIVDFISAFCEHWSSPVAFPPRELRQPLFPAAQVPASHGRASARAQADTNGQLDRQNLLPDRS